MKIIFVLVVIGFYFTLVKADDFFDYEWTNSFFDNVSSTPATEVNQTIQNVTIVTLGKFIKFITIRYIF